MILESSRHDQHSCCFAIVPTQRRIRFISPLKPRRQHRLACYLLWPHTYNRLKATYLPTYHLYIQLMYINDFDLALIVFGCRPICLLGAMIWVRSVLIFIVLHARPALEILASSFFISIFGLMIHLIMGSVCFYFACFEWTVGSHTIGYGFTAKEGKTKERKEKDERQKRFRTHVIVEAG